MDVYDRGLLRLVLHPRRTQDRTLFASTLRFFVPYFPKQTSVIQANTLAELSQDALYLFLIQVESE